MNLSKKVKQRREELGMSQEELALSMGYKSRTSINKIENGRPVTQKIIFRLAEALQTTPAYLMGWEQEEMDSASAKPTEAFAMSIEDTFQHKWMEEVGTTDFSEEELKQIFDFANYIISKRK